MADLAREQVPSTSAVSVEVQDTLFLPERSAPKDGLFSHAYTVVVRNKGTVTVTFERRCWWAREAGKTYGVRGPTIAGKRAIHLAPGEEFSYRTIACFRTPSATMVKGWLEGHGIRAHFEPVKFEVTRRQLRECAGNRANEAEFMKRPGARDFIRRLRERLLAFRKKCARSKRAFEPFQIKPFEQGGEADWQAFENILLRKFPETYTNQGRLTLSTFNDLPDLAICDLFALIDGAVPLGRVHIFGKTPRTKGILQLNPAGAIIPPDMPPSVQHGDAEQEQCVSVRITLRELHAMQNVICGNASPEDSALASGMVERAKTQAAAQAAKHPLAAALDAMTLKQRQHALKTYYAALHEEQEQAGAPTKPWAEARSDKPTQAQFLTWLDSRYPDRRAIGFLLSDLKHLDEPAYKKVDNWVGAGMTKATLESFALPSKITAYDPVRDADAPEFFWRSLGTCDRRRKLEVPEPCL